MITIESLISQRFVDDGWAGIPMSQAVSAAIHRVRTAIKTENGRVRRKVESCPLCSTGDATIIAKKDRYGVPLHTQICMGCGLVFSGQQLTAAFCKNYYKADAAAQKLDGRHPQQLFEHRIAPGAYTWRRKEFVAKALGDRFSNIGLVVEIGCSDGCNLYPYHQMGIKTYGFDYDELRIDTGRENGLNLFYGGIDAARNLVGTVDLVILSHVLEHAESIDQILTDTNLLLAPMGAMYVEVPGILGLIRPRAQWCSVDGYDCSNDLLGYLQFEHNYCFDLVTLKAFSTRNGFRCVAGDDIVRAVFKREDGAPDESLSTNRGMEVLEHLRAVECDYLNENGRFKRVLRRIYYGYGNRLFGQ